MIVKQKGLGNQGEEVSFKQDTTRYSDLKSEIKTSEQIGNIIENIYDYSDDMIKRIEFRKRK